jgi:transcription initiation factor TFIID TATA-box-binding protein
MLSDAEGFGSFDASSGAIDTNDVLARCRQAGRPSPIVIKNCVATAYFGTRLDLEELSWRKHGEFNPRSFAAAKLRLRSPSSTALVFASGKIVCTGAPSESAAHVAVMTYYKMVSEVIPRAVVLDVCIENIVGTGFVGHCVDLRAAYEWLKEYGCVKSMYSPELFPGLRFEIRDFVGGARASLPSLGNEVAKLETKILVFREGNVVICGAKNREGLRVTWRLARELLRRFETRLEVRRPTFRFLRLDKSI